MMRPRLDRSTSLSVVALFAVLFLSYFPLARTRAANVSASILPSAGKPLVNLKNPQSLKVTYTGSSDAVAALRKGTAVATALASADFDADGAIDVVAGYSTGNAGVIAIFRGNKDAFSPTNPALYPKAIQGSIAPTFLSKAQAFSVPESPDLLATGDFNRDGFQDVLVGTKGSNIYLLAGDGTGSLLPAQIVPLTGQLRALAVLPDGHVAASLDNPNGFELVILSPSRSGLVPSASYPLPASGDSVAWGNLGGGADIAVGAGKNIAFIYNALSAKPQTETITVPFQVMGLTLGDFIWDQNGRTEIAALADDGSVQILQHGVLNTAPLTAAQIPARSKARAAKNAQPSNPTALGAWTVAKQLPYSGSAPASPVSASAFTSPHVAQSSTHDVMVLDAGRNQLNILDTSGKTESPSAAVSFSATPVAALALPQTIDATRHLIVLTSAQAAPMSLAVPGTFTFNVNTTADIDTVNACATNSSVTSPPSTLSLREAVCIANNNGLSTVIINVPAGTYDLAISTFGGNGSASSSPELQVGIQNGNNISIVGAGANSTIIQQTVSGSRIIEADEELAGNMPLAISNLTLQNGNCTDSGLDCLDNGGGAILAGGATGDTLTLTNVNFNHNSATSAAGTMGGAVVYTGSSLTITGSTFSGNTASGTGGAEGGGVQAADVVNGSQVSGSVTITNSTFAGNSASSGNDGNADGGGLFFSGNGGFTGSVTSSTFAGNTASSTASTGAATGGGIIAEGGGTDSFSVSDSRIVGNSVSASNATASGFYGLDVDGTITNDWWGCNGGPGASGCDTVVFDQSGGGTSTFNPWLVLSVSANPTQINTGATSTLTADLTHNSLGTGGFSVPNGTPVTFGGTLDSSVNPTSTTLTSGQAASTYTAGSTSGTGSGTATVDNQEVSTTIDILVSVTVTTSPANLSITVDGVTATAPQTYSWVVGSSHTIATTSPQNVSGGTEQVFSSWSDGGAISHSVTAPGSSTTYTASFNTEYQLTTQASPAGDGTITPTSGQYFASGATIPVTATANAGFAFNNWTSTGGSFGSTTSASTNFTMPAAATTVTGNFIPATTQVTITTNPANLLVSVDGGSFVSAPLVETWNQNSNHTIATTSPQSGGTGIQYAFSSWSDGGAISHSITVPSTPTTYTASFATQYQLITSANPTAGGMVSPTSGSYYNAGTVVPLTATANPGYSFTNWTGNVANSTSASTTITMTAPQSVIANFSLIIVAAPTTTSVSSNNNPSFTTPPGNSVTFTATVTSNTTVNEGTVTFSDPANDFTCSGGNTVAVSNGQATCTTSFSTEGSRVITAAYSGTVNFQTSSGFMTQTVNNHTVVNGNQFCNQGPITVPGTAGAATPYPSNIFVSGLSGNIGSITVALNNISSSNITQTDLLLVGPTGAEIVPFASVGDGSTISGVNVTLDDSASGLIPGGSPLTSGSYKPTSITGNPNLIFPSPAPTVPEAAYAATDGSATLTSTFQNSAPNGTWALYAMDNSGMGPSTVGGGWCVNISSASVPVTITTSPAGLLVSADGGTPTAAPLVENWVPGSSHTIATSSPQSGAPGVQYVWSSWSDGGAISHSITVPSTATTYTATFNTQYQLTTQASPPADGTVSPPSGNYYASGATIPVTATANAGFTFSNWISTGGTFDSTTSSSTNFHMPAAPVTVTGNFAAASVQITVTTSPGNLLVSVDGGTFTAAPLVENWVIGSPHTIATTSPQSGGTGVQYVWSSWSDGGAISHSITVPSSATTYTASFNTQYQLTTAANPVNGGTVSPLSGNFYNASTVVPLTATANAGFTFSSWTGNVANANSASTTITMNSPQSVTANFTQTGPIVVLNPTSINFGTAYLLTAKTHSVTVKNTGNATLTITKTSITPGAGTNKDDYSFLSLCPKNLQAGKSCNITVFFFAGNVGNPNATLNLYDNAAGSPQQVSMTATVINPIPSYNPPTVHFGSVHVGNHSTKNVTLTNIGTTDLDVSNVSITGQDAGDFSANSGCPGSLAPNTSCIIAVTFTPTHQGARAASLTVTDNALVNKQNVPLSGSGD